MATALDLWIRRYGDKGEIPEDPRIAAEWEERMAKTYPEAYEILAERETPWK